MFRILLACFLLIASLAQAQTITGDTITSVPPERGYLSFNPTNGSLSVRFNKAGTTTQYRLWTGGVKRVNGSSPDAFGNITVPNGFSATSQLTNDAGFLTSTSGNGLYAQLSGSYVNPSWITSITFGKLTSLPSTRAGHGITDAEGTITAGTTGQVWRGDKTWVTADKTLVGLTNVDNTSDVNKPVSTAQATAIAVKSSAKRFALTTAANGSTVNHALNSSLVAVLFRPTGSLNYDTSYTWTITDANNITITTPYNSSGTRETFTGDVIIFTTN
ncbi:hypothetical protein A6C57_01220 [Fibrella sp. ES10-3-2-2]|nr:hypothetical protein A6C57_01220 [Fibrella sp. ES10-3-2-2]